MPTPSDTASPPRLLVAQALAAAARYPRLEAAPLATAGLDGRDAAFALAIHRAALQRWLTIEHLLNHFLRQPLRKLEPTLRGILLSAGAQMLFMQRVPAYAVVDESVGLACRLIRRGAGNLANAVLRKLADSISGVEPEARWQPAGDRLPLEQGVLVLRRPLLPELASLDLHLSIVTSHPRTLVQAWFERFGVTRATELCLHGIQTPPLIVALESPPTRGSCAPPPPAGASDPKPPVFVVPHAQAGFAIWQGTHAELVAFLAGDPARRVQDPASAQAVELSRGLAPKLILDFCAGRGTKTRQLALLHPSARIVASDPDVGRLDTLRQLAGAPGNIEVVEPAALDGGWAGRRVDLALLDVPCSNTAVLARRIEARYRYHENALASLVELQRRIIADALPRVAPGGHVIYSTCSLEDAENRAQVDWMIERFGVQLVREDSLLPADRGATYHDGFYAALLRRP